MKYIEKITCFILAIFISVSSFSQCDENRIVEICDITTVDSDGVGTPDGIMNLYTATGLTPQAGDEWFDPGFNFILDANTGNLNIWGIKNSSNNQNDHIFELRNGSCTTSGVRASIAVVLGSFSGIALPADANGINVTVCDIVNLCNLPDIDGNFPPSPVDIDLYQALASRTGVPSPHLNGTWVYLGPDSGPDFVNALVSGSNFSADIVYHPGDIDGIDDAFFDFKYVVSGVPQCEPNLPPSTLPPGVRETFVRVSIVRQVFAGFGAKLNYCESEIMTSTEFDTPINLRDDDFLIKEDIEGTWDDMDGTGEISGPDDAEIDFRGIYQSFVAANPKFGMKEFRFEYSVNKRSGVCVDDSEIVKLRIFEELKPFQQNGPIPEICANNSVETRLDLFDYLSFTPNNIYVDNTIGTDFVKWSFVSGPGVSDLDLVKNFEDEIITKPTEAHRGVITISGAVPGTYVFEYSVDPKILLENSSLVPESIMYNNPLANPPYCSPIFSPEHPCPVLTAQVSLVILPFDYAGEDTPSNPSLIPEFCESDVTIDLRSALETNGTAIATTGVWTDAADAVVPNEFVIPSLTSTSQDFDFTYTTTTSKGCTDTARLRIRVFKEPNAGTGVDGKVCRSQDFFNLFSLLTDADTTGYWIGPFGYNSLENTTTMFQPHLGRLTLSDNFQSGTYTYILPNNGACIFPQADRVSVQLDITEVVEINFNQNNRVFCSSLGQVNLFDYLNRTTSPLTGTFTRVDTGEVLTDGVFVFGNLPDNQYRFEYRVVNGVCAPVTANIDISVIDVSIPDEILPTTFCSFDNPILNDVNMINYIATDGTRTAVNNVAWYATPDSNDILPLNTSLTNGQELFVAAQSVTGCESDRVKVTFRVNQNQYAGEDTPSDPSVLPEFCRSQNRIDLRSVLETNGSTIAITGVWTDSNGEVVSNNFDIPTLNDQQDFNFTYTTTTDAGCVDTSSLTIRVFGEIPIKEVSPTEFCVLDAATLDDITKVVNIQGEEITESNLVWYTSPDGDETIRRSSLLEDRQKIYVAFLADNGCESARLEVEIDILNLGEENCTLEFQDGVSPNERGENDTFNITQWRDQDFNIPTVFEAFELQIFNRYGTLVYRANKTTEEFRGIGNTGIQLGKNLPSGVYFYILNPNKNENRPIQGNFYLSK